jgi:hypothetical protein
MTDGEPRRALAAVVGIVARFGDVEALSLRATRKREIARQEENETPHHKNSPVGYSFSFDWSYKLWILHFPTFMFRTRSEVRQCLYLSFD